MFGAYIGSFTTTTNITTDDKVISTGLPAAGWVEDDSLNEFFYRATSGNNDDIIRFIEDYTGSTGQLTIAGANQSAESGATTFEIYRVDPNILIDALNDARMQAYPMLYRRIEDNTLTLAAGQQRYARPTSIPAGGVRQVYMVPRLDAKSYADNLPNDKDCDLEGSTIGTDWTATQNTISYETETSDPNNFMVWAGNQSGKSIVTASNAGSVYLSLSNPTNYDGEELNVGLWVYSKTADRLKAAVDFDSAGSPTEGDFHTGNGWERLTVSATVNNPSTSIEVGVTTASGATFPFYWDELVVTAGQSEIPRGPRDMIEDWYESGDNIYLRSQYSEARNLLVVGMGTLTAFTSTGTSTMELEDTEARALYYHAAAIYHEGYLAPADSAQLSANQRIAAQFRRRAEEGVGHMIAPALLRRP